MPSQPLSDERHTLDSATQGTDRAAKLDTQEGTPPVRVGLIGYGLAGSVFHAPLITTTAGMQLAAIVTGNPDRVQAARDAHPEAQVVATTDELWNLDTIDLVVIATPNTTHAPIATEAIDHGIAVVVDKPIALTSQEADRLVQHAADRGVLLTVFQNRRWDGDFQTVRALVESGEIGAVARFESRFERWRPTVKQGWRESAGVSAGGGILYDLGPHIVDQALTLFGPAQSVYAEVDTTRPDAQVDDDVFIAITHRSGVRSHLFASAITADLGPRFRVLGTRGGYSCFGLDGQEDALRAGRLPGPGWGEVPSATWGNLTGIDGSPTPTATLPGDYPSFYRMVVDALRNHGRPPVDPADAVASLQVIEAARESSQSSRVIQLDES